MIGITVKVFTVSSLLLCISALQLRTSRTGNAPEIPTNSTDASEAVQQTSCPRVPEIKNIKNVNCGNKKPGETCLVQCMDGYKAKDTSSLTITCQDDFTWKHPESCSRIFCKPIAYRLLNKKNMTRGSCSLMSINDTCVVGCKPGYEKVGDKKRIVKCTLSQNKLNGTLIGLQNIGCKKKECQKPNFPNMNANECEGIPFGSSCTVRCQHGFRFSRVSTEKSISCDFDASRNTTPFWEEIGKCKKIACPIFPTKSIEDKNIEILKCIPIGRLARYVNESCDLKCRKDYEDSSRTKKSVTCQLNKDGLSGRWAGYRNMSCSKKKCPRLTLANTNISGCQNRQFGSSCTIRCGAGFEFSDGRTSKEIQCDFPGQQNTVPIWTGSEACKKKMECLNFPTTDIEDKNLEISHCDAKYLNESCDLKCKKGFEDSSKTTKSITCQLMKNGVRGMWVGYQDKSCSKKKCKTPVLTQTITESCGNTTFGSSCPIRCEEGFKFQNGETEKNIRCVFKSSMAEPEWEELKTCERIKCTKFERKIYRNLITSNCTNVETDSSCEIRCKYGYKFANGERFKKVSCDLNGTAGRWNPSPSRISDCQEITCPRVGALLKPTSLSTKTPITITTSCKSRRMKFGSKCTFRCPEGYEFEKIGKTKTATCNATTESWVPSIEDIGLCQVSITETKSCQYWSSGEPVRGIKNARQRCSDILGERSVLAMTKTQEVRLFARSHAPYFVGASVANDSSASWDDQDEIKVLNSGSGNCVVLTQRSVFRKVACSSSNRFICERPAAFCEPCAQNPCKSGGTCVPYGCSFKCECKENFYGHTCEKGPFEMTISTTRLGTRTEIKYVVKSNAGKARFELYENGEKKAEVDEIQKINKTGNYLVKNEENDVYITGKIFLENDHDIATYECVRVKAPNAVHPSSVTKNACDGTVLNVMWNGLGNDVTSKLPYDIYVNNDFRENSTTKFHKITGLKSSTSYDIKIIPHLEGCRGRTDLFETYIKTTSKGPPDPPAVNMAQMDRKDSKCPISWKVTAGKVEREFQIKVTEYARNTFKVGESPHTNERSFDVNRTRFQYRTSPNSIYEVEVGTKPIDVCKDVLPISWSNKTYGCETDSSPPRDVEIPMSVSSNPDDGTVSMELGSVDERNGQVSCYLVIVQKMNLTDGRNSTELPTTDINGMVRPNITVNVGDSYVAVALARFEGSKNVILGKGNATCCDLRSSDGSCAKNARRRRAVESDIHGDNLELEPSSTYRHYVIVSTPTRNGDPAVTASPWSDSWSVGVVKPQDNDSLVIALPIVLVIILCMLLVVGIIIYRRKRRKKDGQPDIDLHAFGPVNGGQNQDNEEPIYANDLNFDHVTRRNLSKYSIELARLREVIQTKRADEDRLFYQEFKVDVKKTVAQCELTSDFAKLPANRPKNRYNNIAPYDSSRVILENLPGNQFSDYINAAYVDGYVSPKKFIATQGPLPETIGDFWRMIWEQGCYCIVMLTNIVEKHKIKCSRYWPEDEGNSQEHGGITVTWKETASFGDYVRRKICIAWNGEERDIFQFHFIAWPDHGAPGTTSSILRLHKSVFDSQLQSSGPIVVHCSAGVGRTGTFIGLDILSEQIKEADNINVPITVAKMRMNRPEMVQTLDQYIFLHKLILEIHQFDATDAEVSEFNALHNNLKGYHVQSAQKIAEEFARLSDSLPLETSTETALKPSNKHLNRDASVIPYDHNLAIIQMLPTDKEVPYFNASVINSYRPAYNFIVAQNPDNSSTEIFWRAVLDNGVSMLVNLCEENEKANYCYWPELSEEVNHESVSVRTLEESSEIDLSERKFEVGNKTKKITVSQIVYSGWSKNLAPKSTETILEIIAKVEKHHQSLFNAEKKTTLVHCSDGAGRSGTFCAISNLIERLKNENKVDVFRTVKDLRDQRKMMVTSEGQYDCCYKSVAEFLKSFDLYGNFQ